MAADRNPSDRNLRRGTLVWEELHDDPHGGVRPGVRSMSQRAIDLGYFAGFLSPAEYDAATRLRDSWERCRLVPDTKAAALEALGRSESGRMTLKRWDNHRHAMAAVGPAAGLVLTQIVLHDEPPWEYGNRRRGHGPTLLGAALARLMAYFERNEDRWREEKNA